jgi:RimJ/RimL family protein N-acetyltransferase
MLRLWKDVDAGALAAAVTASLEHLKPWMPWISFEPVTLENRRQLIAGWTRDWLEGRDATFGVFDVDGDVVGSAGLHRRGGPDALDIGYWIHVDYLRRGFATELTTALTTAAFNVDGITVVRVQTDEANKRSASVPAKLGFHRSAQIVEREPAACAPSKSGRVLDWTMTRTAWSERGLR